MCDYLYPQGEPGLLGVTSFRANPEKGDSTR